MDDAIPTSSNILGAFDDAQAQRTYSELMLAAKALQEGQTEELELILAEAADLQPVRQEAVLRAIKKATGTPLGALRQQIAAEDGSGEEPDHLDLARATLAKWGEGNAICMDSFVWRWQDRGVWEKQPDRAVKKSCQATLDDTSKVRVTANLVAGVSDVLKSDVFIPNHRFNLGNPETVNCLNGELALGKFGWSLKPHCRENFRTTQIPVAYDADADAPKFTAFLEQAFRGDEDRADKMTAVLELMGYSLMSHARHEMFVMLVGSGANGKSVLLAVLEGLLGLENIAAVQPSSFDNSFQRAHLHEKLANVVSELKQGEIIADAALKAITSGEAATVEQKHRDPFVMHPFCTCWFSTNHMPYTRDFSDALFRRARILTFNRFFAEHERDRTLKDKLLVELPGILNMSLNAYANALIDGFTEPKSSVEAKQEWRLEVDQVALFIDECCTEDKSARTPISEVYGYYKYWADENGIRKTLGKKGLRDRLTRLGFGSERDNQNRYVTGLKL